jgi:nicotinate-nucleotide adenylyltransferase
MGRVIGGVEFGDAVFEPTPTAWAAPAGAPVLLFGGSFDPAHRAHIELAIRARDALFGAAGWLVFVPAARNPLKPEGPVAGDADRVAMLGLAIGGTDRCEVWTDEIDRGGASFWVHTLARAASVAGGARLRFLIGADQALAFERWREAGVILSLAEPAVLLREPTGTREAFRRAMQMSGQDPGEWMGRLIGGGVMAGSSTEIRAAIAAGRDVSALVGSAVKGYIRERGLYRAR